MKPGLSTLLTLVAACLSGVALFWTSQSVQTQSAHHRYMQTAIESERESIRVLEAEWSYLNRPDRLEALSSAYLGMEPPTPGQVLLSPDSLADVHISLKPARKPLMQVHPAALLPVPDGVNKQEPSGRVRDDGFLSLLDDWGTGGGAQ